LKKPLAIVREVVELSRPDRKQEDALRAALREIAKVAARRMETFHARSRNAGGKSIHETASRFERVFGHPPGSITEMRRRKFRTENTCIDIAQAIAHVLSSAVDGKRIGVIRISGPEQNHPSIALETAHGKTYVVDNWGMDQRRGVDERSQLEKALETSIGNPRHRLFWFSHALGYSQLKNPHAPFEQNHVFQIGGLELLRAAAHENHVLAHLENDNDREALHHANQALRQAPKSDNAHFLKGNVYFYRRKFRKAIACYEKALQLNPFHTPALESMAYAYKKCKDRAAHQAVQKKLGKIVTFEPKSKEAIWNLQSFMDEIYPEDKWAPKIKLKIRVLKDQ